MQLNTLLILTGPVIDNKSIYIDWFIDILWYCIAGFYCKNFILVSQGIRNIKIRC